MTPRVLCPQGLSFFNCENDQTLAWRRHVCLRPAARQTTAAAQSLQPLVQTAQLSQREKKRIQKQDPYRWAQMQARRAVNVQRRQEIEKARDAGWGNQIHGLPTPFVESLDSAGQAPLSTPATDKEGVAIEEPHPLPTSPHILNHQLTRQELDEAIQMAYQLSKPMENANRIVVDPVAEEQERQEHEARHRRAVVALERITALENASSKGRRHANIRRCIETFGRHQTDLVLEPKPRAPGLPPREELQRGGPDTGSPEVQVAILTTKIRALSQQLEGRIMLKDKANHRNLRLLCHRRQKMLRYLDRKEKGSERWTNLITTLGLSPATWKEQIAF